jgi:hypothetical protein
MPVSRRTRAEHDKPISKVQKFIDGVGFWSKGSFVMAYRAPSKVTIHTDQTRDFSDVHIYVNYFVWDPIQTTYWSQSRGASFAPKKARK